MGEVHTALLQTSGAVPPEVAVNLLTLVPGQSVLLRERPIRHASSPDVLTGIDCEAPSTALRKARLVGTPASRISLVGGHVLQAATRVRLRSGAGGRRHSWAHYLARPGVAEVLGSVQDDDVTAGFLAGAQSPAMDLGAINSRLIGDVQRDERLDHRPPFRVPRTRLRWVAGAPGEGAQRVVFTVCLDGVRTVRLHTAVDDPAALDAFCADLALHDWLLTTLVTLVDRARIGYRTPQGVLARLRPAVDHLIHTWMPGVRVVDSLDPLWAELERRSRLSQQWQKTVERIRDQVSLSIVEGLKDLPAPPNSGRSRIEST